MSNEARYISDYAMRNWSYATTSFAKASCYHSSEAILYQPNRVNINTDETLRFDLMKELDDPSAENFLFSRTVHRLFWMMVISICAGIMFSVFALISEKHEISIVAAIVLASSLVLASLWLERAEHEWREK